jgi:hypothetical protein
VPYSRAPRQNLTVPYVREITGRDNRRCVPCWRPIRGDRGGTWDLWHRIPHDLHTPTAKVAIRHPANLLTMCEQCMDLCRLHPLLARQFGYRVWRSVSPVDVPVLYGGKDATAAWPVTGEMWLLSDLAAVRVRRTRAGGVATLAGLSSEPRRASSV